MNFNLFEIESTHVGGQVKVLRARTIRDDRGEFNITYLQDEFESFGLPKFVRSMYTRSERNVLRGLHYQLDPPMSKLMHVVNGGAFLVAVDIDPLSPTFLQYHSIIASDFNKVQVWAPANFARGYYTLQSNTIVQYHCDAHFNQDGDEAIHYADPQIRIDWPFQVCGTTNDPELIISPRDRNAPYLRKIEWIKT